MAITLGRQDAPRSSFAHDVCVVICPSIMYLRLIESFGGWMLESAAEQATPGVSQGPQLRQGTLSTVDAVNDLTCHVSRCKSCV